MDALHRVPKSTVFQFEPWTVTSVVGHILVSEGQNRERFISELKLPQVPEMIYADNVLRVKHSSGFGLEFTTLEALKLVDAEHDLMKVAVADAWQEARIDCEHIKEVVKPFDWTFTTNYQGTLIGTEPNTFKVSETTERIDMEKLKVRETIRHYADVLLFEDELADNGSAVLRVKIRVMPTSFFLLLRFYLRVDGVLIRQNDTRFYHEMSNNYILKEYSSKEKTIGDLKVPPHILVDENEISDYLDIKEFRVEKLEFPTSVVDRVENQTESQSIPDSGVS